MKIIGTGASNGISIGKALLLKTELINISQKKIKATEVDKEIEKLDLAIKTVRTDLETLIEKTKIKLGNDQAAIFEAHLTILEDPELYSQIKDLLVNNHLNLLAAVDASCNQFVAIFQTLDDEYMRERAADILDIRQRLLNKISGIKEIALDNIQEEVIIVANDLTPSQTSQLDPKFVKGFLCNIGGRTSHSAIMARSLGIPAVVGLKNVTEIIKEGGQTALNGETGEVITDLNATEAKIWEEQAKLWSKAKLELAKYIGQKTITKDGYQVKVEANIGSGRDIDNVLANDCEGIGLFRTEFLYMENTNFPSEEEQFIQYKLVLEKINHKVVIRTLDIGGDKELSYWDLPKEMNPFLGYRAIRLCLDRKDIFRTQIRALLRASYFGKLAIMFPMIATIEEFKNAKQFVLDCKKELIAEGQNVNDNIEIGMMMEIPAAAVNAESFARYADFFSIGTNDLLQYSFAADRMSEKVSYLYQPYNPSFLKLLKMIIEGAKAHDKKIPVGMCGEMAGDKFAVPLLLGLGLDEFSMSASDILATRKLINNWTKKDAEQLVAKALLLETNDEVLNLIKKTTK